jgi:hypothetical protein
MKDSNGFAEGDPKDSALNKQLLTPLAILAKQDFALALPE